MVLSISIQYKSFSCWSIWDRDETLTDTTTLGLSEPKNNGNEGVLYTLLIFRNGTSSSDTV